MITDDYEKMLPELQALATRYSISRLKLSTLNFDREFRQGVDGNLQLVSSKAIIRVLGKTTKVPIGDGAEFSTFEDAFEATKKHWSEYYKTIRANRTPEQLAIEAKRQKRYRARRRDRATQLKRQQ